jgi:hypothetical protein
LKQGATVESEKATKQRKKIPLSQSKFDAAITNVDVMGLTSIHENGIPGMVVRPELEGGEPPNSGANSAAECGSFAQRGERFMAYIAQNGGKA